MICHIYIKQSLITMTGSVIYRKHLEWNKPFARFYHRRNVLDSWGGFLGWLCSTGGSHCIASTSNTGQCSRCCTYERTSCNKFLTSWDMTSFPIVHFYISFNNWNYMWKCKKCIWSEHIAYIIRSLLCSGTRPHSVKKACCYYLLIIQLINNCLLITTIY